MNGAILGKLDRGFFMNKDLTVGKPASVLWKYSLPLFGSIIFQQLYNIADSFVAGRWIGTSALAAVGNYIDLYRICVWLQYRYLGRGSAALRIKKL